MRVKAGGGGVPVQGEVLDSRRCLQGGEGESAEASGTEWGNRQEVDK